MTRPKKLVSCHSGSSHGFPLQQSTQPSVKSPPLGRRGVGHTLATIERVSECSLHVRSQVRLMGPQTTRVEFILK